MKLPNWFKIVWWILLSAALALLLSNRFGAISNGTATPVDAFLFLIWVSLLLLPLFKEFEFFGIKCKAELENLKSEVKDQFSNLRNEIHSTINSQINPQIYLNPPPDTQLPQIEQRFRKILEETMKSSGLQTPIDIQAELILPQNVNYLFLVRYAIEKELRRIYRDRVESRDIARGALSVFKIVQALKEMELLDSRLANIVREVYAISSPAVHGEPVTDEKLNFVRDIAPNLITALTAIK